MYITINTGNVKTIVSGFASFDINSEIFSQEIPSHPFYDEQMQHLKRIIEERTDGNIQALGIAHTGIIGADGQVLLGSSYLPSYDKKNITKDLQSFLPNTKIYVENDSACATIAEKYFGKAQEYDSVVCLYLSAGIGGAYLKKIENIYSLFPADTGHQIIQLNGRICICGQRGCLEAYVGSESIRKRFLKEQADISDERIWKEIVEYMAIGAANLYTMFYPASVVISGETLDEVPYIREKLIERIKERNHWDSTKNIPILLSDFGAKGPTYGALALVKIREGENTIQVIY